MPPLKKKEKKHVSMLVLVQLRMQLFLVPSSDEYKMNIDEFKMSIININRDFRSIDADISNHKFVDDCANPPTSSDS